MLDEPSAGDFATARQIIENASRQAYFAEDIHQLGRDDGRLLGRLHYDRIARGERGDRHAGENGERKVPGSDDTDNAARKILEAIFLAGNIDALLRLQANCLTGIELA